MHDQKAVNFARLNAARRLIDSRGAALLIGEAGSQASAAVQALASTDQKAAALLGWIGQCWKVERAGPGPARAAGLCELYAQQAERTGHSTQAARWRLYAALVVVLEAEALQGAMSTNG